MDFDGPNNTGIAKADGLPGQEAGSAVLGYYNGDPVYKRDGAQTYGVNFSEDALAICKDDDTDACKGNFPTPPSGSSAVGSLSGSFDLLVSSGLYLTMLSFYYTDSGTGSRLEIQLFSDGTRLDGPPAFSTCGTGICPWALFEVSPGYLATKPVTSVTFSSTTGTTVFDNIEFSTASRAIPEPSTYVLALLGLALVTAAGRRRKC